MRCLGGSGRSVSDATWSSCWLEVPGTSRTFHRYSQLLAPPEHTF
jgi:hypothetical protein